MSGEQEKLKNDYQVGYGKPPVKSRFSKGRSGNPTGKRRPPDEAEHASRLIRQEVFRLLTIREGDKVTRMPALQAVLRSQITSAAKGNIQAQRAVLKSVQDFTVAAGARRSEGVASKRPNKDMNDMSDEELMAILGVAQNEQKP